jgi:peptidoglycan/LPS O-acetylase OafA/YrhL
MRFYVPVFGTNGPLWSLAYEWWFYMFYPVLFFINRFSSILSALFVILLYILINLLDFNIIILNKVFAYLPAWWLGAFLADIYTNRLKISFISLSPLAILLVILPFEFFKLNWNNAVDLIWALGFFGLFSLLFLLQSKGYNLYLLNKLKGLGDISYSLYVIHMPVLVLLSGTLLQFNNNKLPMNFYFVFTGIIISLFFGWLSYKISEQPFQRSKIKPSYSGITK